MSDKNNNNRGSGGNGNNGGSGTGVKGNNGNNRGSGGGSRSNNGNNRGSGGNGNKGGSGGSRSNNGGRGSGTSVKGKGVSPQWHQCHVSGNCVGGDHNQCYPCLVDIDGLLYHHYPLLGKYIRHKDGEVPFTHDEFVSVIKGLIAQVDAEETRALEEYEKEMQAIEDEAEAEEDSDDDLYSDGDDVSPIICVRDGVPTWTLVVGGQTLYATYTKDKGPPSLAEMVAKM